MLRLVVSSMSKRTFGGFMGTRASVTNAPMAFISKSSRSVREIRRDKLHQEEMERRRQEELDKLRTPFDDLEGQVEDFLEESGTKPETLAKIDRERMLQEEQETKSKQTSPRKDIELDADSFLTLTDEQVFKLLSEQPDYNENEDPEAQQWLEEIERIESTIDFILDEDAIHSYFNSSKEEQEKRSCPNFTPELITGLLEKEGSLDVVSFDVSPRQHWTNYQIICTSLNDRHARSIADLLAIQVKKYNKILGEYNPEMNNFKFPVEGRESAKWIAVDLGHIIVNIMDPFTRKIYSLEEKFAEDSVPLSFTTLKTQE